LSKSIKPGWCFVGFHADSMYGSSREANFVHHREGEEAYREYRRKASDLDNYTNLWDITYIGVKNGVNYIDAYRNEELREFILGLDKKDIWKGRIKVLPYKAFIDYFKRGAWLREPEPMQIVTGIREWHNTLLNSPWNKKGWRRVDKVYLELAKEHGISLKRDMGDEEETDGDTESPGSCEEQSSKEQ